MYVKACQSFYFRYRGKVKVKTFQIYCTYNLSYVECVCDIVQGFLGHTGSWHEGCHVIEERHHHKVANCLHDITLTLMKLKYVIMPSNENILNYVVPTNDVNRAIKMLTPSVFKIFLHQQSVLARHNRLALVDHKRHILLFKN